jgi:hypothetical protein
MGLLEYLDEKPRIEPETSRKDKGMERRRRRRRRLISWPVVK